MLLEKKTIKSCTAIVTVSDAVAANIRNLHDKKVFVIPNGYIPFHQKSEFNSVNDRLTIIHTGRWYPNSQSVNILFRALDIIRNDRIDDLSRYKVTFYGPVEAELQREVEMQKLEDVVNVQPSQSAIKTSSFNTQLIYYLPAGKAL